MDEPSRGYDSVADRCGLVELLSLLLVRYGSNAQRAEWLEPLLIVVKKPAYCMNEPVAGTDITGIRTSSDCDEAGWRLNEGNIRMHNLPVADLAFVLREPTRVPFTRSRVFLSFTSMQKVSTADAKSTRQVGKPAKSIAQIQRRLCSRESLLGEGARIFTL